MNLHYALPPHHSQPPDPHSTLGRGRGGTFPQEGSLKGRRSPARSSTSSAYSGSASLHDGEGGADSEGEEGSVESFPPLDDAVRECLERERDERTEEDVDVLLDFLAPLPAFARLPSAVKRDLCWRMVFAVVDRAGRTVMEDGEQLDSWRVSSLRHKLSKIKMFL